MMPLTYVELFAGAGGLSRGLEMAGWACVAHAEWDAHARAVLRRHWPDTPLFGDVSTLTGQMIHDASGGRPVTMLTGGSPCQDLSIAGKRAGMTEDSGTRSSLYFDQVRLWHELNAISPCPYFLWENVLGALSSNHGKDFAAVLSALVGTPVAVPENGWKGGGGVVSGCAGVAAWRVLDCQYFGPPQRRRRVFVLGVRAGGVDPAEVLSLLDGLSGHLESCDPSAENAPPDAGSGVAGGGDDGETGALTPWDSQSKRIYATTGVMASLQAAENGGQQQIAVLSRVTIPIDTRNATRTSELDAQNRQGIGVGEDGDPSPTLTGLFVPAVYDARGNGTGSVVSTLPGDHLDRITDYTPVVMRQREGKAGGGKGPLVSDKSLSLTATSDQILFTQQALGEYADKGVASSIKERDHKDKIGRVLVVAPTLAAGAHPGSYNGQDGAQVAAAKIAAATDDDALAVNVSNGAASVDNVMGTLGARSGGSEVGAQTRGVVMASLVRPRRLMPIECERLMGWPEWTKTVTFHVCPEHQKRRAAVVGQNRKSPSLAGSAEKTDAPFRVLSVVTSSAGRQAPADGAVQWRVAISLATSRVTISNAQLGSCLFASTADSHDTFDHLVKLARTVPLSANQPTIAAKTPQAGEGELPQHTPLFIPVENGSNCASRFGGETTDVAKGAESVRSGAKSTISPATQNSQTNDSTWETLFSSVADAISGFIPEQTQRDTSYICEVTVSTGHTERGIDEQGRDYALSDSARYKLCGNGVASPVAGWIGWRLRDTLEAIP